MTLTLLLAIFLAAVDASPLFARQSITTLTAGQIASFKPFTWFAGAAYCSPTSTLAWNCGPSCDPNPDFIPVASGGDGGLIQFWFVGFSPPQNTVIVSHQGTDVTRIESILTDAALVLAPLNPLLFPGVDLPVLVHAGFALAQMRSATQVLEAVQKAIADHGATRITVVGHSLGAAIALLDSVYLPLHLNGTSVSMIGYGMPRVGNQAFADYVDDHVPVTHINNKEDFVPIIPGRSAGYHHPSGEVHIQDSGEWVSCPGQDNPSVLCTVGDVRNIAEGNEPDHSGPYDGVLMGAGC